MDQGTYVRQHKALQAREAALSIVGTETDPPCLTLEGTWKNSPHVAAAEGKDQGG